MTAAFETPSRNASVPSGADAPFVWHAAPVEDCLSRLDTQAGGLTSAEAARRLVACGHNRLPTSSPRSALMRLAAQFNNLLIVVLMAAGIVAGLLGHWVDAQSSSLSCW